MNHYSVSPDYFSHVAKRAKNLNESFWRDEDWHTKLELDGGTGKLSDQIKSTADDVVVSPEVEGISHKVAQRAVLERIQILVEEGDRVVEEVDAEACVLSLDVDR